jgi:hypothetical protein
MSQRAVENLLGRLITDGRLREKFFQDPAGVCLRESFDLTTRELEALLTLDETGLERFARSVDAHIVRVAREASQASELTLGHLRRSRTSRPPRFARKAT